MIKYTIYQQKRKGGNNLFYGRAVHDEIIDFEVLAERIQRNASVKKSDCLAVLSELAEVMNDELASGKKVRLNDVGLFWLSIKSSGAITEDEYSATDNIKGVRVKFLPEGHKSNGVMSRAFTQNLTFKRATGSVK
ncbi:MAG: HU family DNA-binding protein [Prevotella sp.]|nr:HU family DNA-binding protein [Candidatus Prevotella equi]